jgi:Ca-activated chloride channel family protein
MRKSCVSRTSGAASMWSLADPLALLLLPLPFLARFLLPPRRRESGAFFVPSAIAGAMAEIGSIGYATHVRRALPTLMWLMLVLALAGPRMLGTSDAIPSSGRDIVLALDLSGSMEKEDFNLDGQDLSRLQAVQKVGAHFVRRRVGDRIGLVIFGDRAYFGAPLTFDTVAVARAIQEAVIGISGRSTAISDGLGLAVKRLSKSDAPSRVVILLSDGVDTKGTVSAIDVAGLAKEHGIRVHTIALGPVDLETAPKTRDAVDTKTLREVAEESGGQSFRVKNMSDLTAVADALDALEPSPTLQPPLEVHHEYWMLPAGLALLLAVVIAFMHRTTE